MQKLKPIAVVTGTFFGKNGEGRARLMFACPTENIDKCADRIDQSVRG
jgi:aspartate/methionine/tyrosine aminotransferase